MAGSMGSKRALSTTHPLELEDVGFGAAPAAGTATMSARAATAMLPTTGPPTRLLRPIGVKRVPTSGNQTLSGAVGDQLVVVPLGAGHQQLSTGCRGDAAHEAA